MGADWKVMCLQNAEGKGGKCGRKLIGFDKFEIRAYSRRFSRERDVPRVLCHGSLAEQSRITSHDQTAIRSKSQALDTRELVPRRTFSTIRFPSL